MNQKVKCLRIDNGLEFSNMEIDTFCKENGIQSHWTCTYTPKQNGVAEFMNHTIMEKVPCMLKQFSLSERFWTEFAITTAYMINMTPSSVINNNILKEIWIRRNLDTNT